MHYFGVALDLSPQSAKAASRKYNIIAADGC